MEWLLLGRRCLRTGVIVDARIVEEVAGRKVSCRWLLGVPVMCKELLASALLERALGASEWDYIIVERGEVRVEGPLLDVLGVVGAFLLDGGRFKVHINGLRNVEVSVNRVLKVDEPEEVGFKHQRPLAVMLSRG